MAGMQHQTFEAQVNSRGLLEYRYPDVVANYLLSTFGNKFVEVSFKLPVKRKTQKQLGWYYGCVLPTIHSRLVELGYTIDVFGQQLPLNKDYAHQIIKQFCARLGPDGHLYSSEQYPKAEVVNVRDMDRLMKSEFTKNAIAFGNNRLDCRIPPEPDKNWKEKKAGKLQYA